MRDKIVINDYIENDPLSEENLDKTLKTVNKFRLLLPNKSIWIYSGYRFNDEECWVKPKNDITNIYRFMRQEIIKNVDVMVDGRYIDSQRDITLRWRGSKNQRVIDIKQTLEKGEIVLWCE